MSHGVMAMMMTPLLPTGRLDESPDKPIPSGSAKRALKHDRHLAQVELRPDFIRPQLPESNPLGAEVQISPIDAVKRHRVAGHGMLAESVYAPIRSKIEFRFNAPVHLLAMYDDGSRREGETLIDELPPSRFRNFANKLTFIPAGHAYREWHEIREPLRVTFLYVAQAKLQTFESANAAYVPRAFFENTAIRQTATKLKSVIERDQPGGALYAEMLANVLGYELLHSDDESACTPRPYRGGLASWQTRAVIGYIEQHMDEQIALITLARIAQLSEYYFCRAFKQSFGIPPRQYQLHQRIQRGKVLLSDRTNSITNVALSLGYSHSSSFTLAFHKITGRTPTQYRRASL
jgi:AraC family transcriptional regulator